MILGLVPRRREAEMTKKPETSSSLGEYARVIGELNGGQGETKVEKQAEPEVVSEGSPAAEQPAEDQDRQPPADGEASEGET